MGCGDMKGVNACGKTASVHLLSAGLPLTLNLETVQQGAGRPSRAVVDATGSQAEGLAHHTWRSLLQR